MLHLSHAGTSGGSRKFWWGGFEAQNLKNSDILTKIESDFSAELGNSNIFFAQIQVVSKKKKKKKRSSPKLRVIFRPNSVIQTFFSPKFWWSPKKLKKKKKKRSSPKLRLIFRPKSEIQTFFSPKFRWSKKKVFTKIETDFSPDSLRLGRWGGGCIPKWSRIIRNRG